MPTRRSNRIALFILSGALLLSAGDRAGAQAPIARERTAAIVGWIHDGDGNPVALAVVEIESMHAMARTDSGGRFVLRSLEPGGTTVRIRRIGFDPQTFDVVLRAASVDSVSVTMDVNAQVLDAVRTNASLDQRKKALDGFYRRKANGSGVYITRDDIERRNTNVLSEMVQDVPGIRLMRAGPRHGLRFDSAALKRYDCPPQYWVDGRRVAGADIDDFPAVDVDAMELYRGPSTTPVQFTQNTVVACGTVVIWTRVPGVP